MAGRALILMAALGVASAANAADGIAIAARGPGTTMTSLNGVNTSKARITATLTQADYDACVEAGGQACSNGHMKPGDRFSFAADCKAETVVDIDGGRYRRAGNWAVGEDGAGFFEGQPKFVDARGDVVPAPQAGFGGRLAVNYEHLCPKAAAAVVAIKASARSDADIMDPSKLDGTIIWDHNGSEMLIDADKGVIVYDRPKASISKTVKPGQVLFRGKIAPMGAVSGTAYTFKQGCAPAPYAVKGRWNDEGVLTLTGSAPKRSKVGCDIAGRRSGGAHSTLKFTFLVSP